MKKAIAIIVSLMFVFALSAVSFAEERTATTEAAPAEEKASAKKEAKKQVTGEVTAVDANANTLTVKKGKEEVTVTVDDKTKIMAGKDQKTLADVKVGDKVTVRYKVADDNNVAKSIELKGAPAKKAAGY